MWASALLCLLAMEGGVAQTIVVTCESQERPFCGEYQLREDVWGEDTVFKMSKDDKEFQIIKDDTTGEYCICLRPGLHLCGRPRSAELTKVKGGRRSVQTGYSMVFDLEACDDLYGDCGPATELPVARELSGGVDAGENSLPFMVRLRVS